jgi:cytochrome oxidase assembly protein ShyY1
MSDQFYVIWSIAVVITVALGTWQVYRVLTGKTGERPDR